MTSINNKLVDFLKDINKYYEKYPNKISIIDLNNWLLDNKSILDFFDQVFNKREFNVKVSENYLTRILKDYDLTIKQIGEYGEKLRVEKVKDEKARKSRNKKILIVAIISVLVISISGFGYYSYSKYQELLIDITNFKSNSFTVYNNDNIFNSKTDSIIILNKELINPSKFALKPSSQFCCYTFIPNKDLESTFKKPITQFIDTVNVLNYNPKQKIQNIIANKIIREVETESMFEYGVGGFINGNYSNLSYFNRAKDLTNRFTVFDENIIEYFGNDSINIEYIENNTSEIESYLNNNLFKTKTISASFFNKTKLIEKKLQPKSFKLKLPDDFYQEITACDLPIPLCEYINGNNKKIIISATQEIFIVDYIISEAYARYYGIIIQDNNKKWNLLWVNYTEFDEFEIKSSNSELPLEYNLNNRKDIIFKTINIIQNTKPNYKF